MMEKSEYHGHWWLPENPEHKVFGTLRLDPEEGATLNLSGVLGGLEGPIIPFEVRESEVTLGISLDGKSITLDRSGRVFFGEHFHSSDNIGFERLIVEYLHLDVWAGISGFDIEAFEALEASSGTVRYRPPAPIIVSVGEDYEVRLVADAVSNWTLRPITEVSITQKVRLVIAFQEKKPLDYLLGIAYHIQNFLSLGLRTPAHPLCVWGVSGIPGEVAPVEIHYRSTSKTLATTGSEDRPRKDYMLFSIVDLSSIGFGLALNNWLQKAEQLEPVYYRYFGTIYNPWMYIEQKFLSLVQALEVYHRRVLSTDELPDEEHERRLDAIYTAVPEEYKDWLENRLKYSHEPRLRKRLKEIAARYSEGVASILGNSDARKSFLNKVYVTRNYRTHYDENLESQAARGEELHYINEKLTRLVEICLLGEIGFDSSEIKDLISARL